MEKKKFELNYKLTGEEVIKSLKDIKYVSQGASQWIKTALLVILIGIITYNMTIDLQGYLAMSIILLSISVLLIVLIWLAPVLALNSAAKRYAGIDIILEVEGDTLTIDSMKKIALNGSTKIVNNEENSYIMVYLHEKLNEFVLIPYRVVPEEEMEEFIAIMMKDQDVPAAETETDDDAEEAEDAAAAEEIEVKVEDDAETEVETDAKVVDEAKADETETEEKDNTQE